MILASLLPHFLAFQSSFVQSLPGYTLSWTFSMVGFKYSCAKFGIGMSGPCHSPRIFFSVILSANACTLFHPLLLFFLEAWIRATFISSEAIGFVATTAAPDAALPAASSPESQIFDHNSFSSWDGKLGPLHRRWSIWCHLLQGLLEVLFQKAFLYLGKRSTGDPLLWGPLSSLR